MGLTSLAENVLELPELSMLQDIGWRSTDPCPHRFSQSMTVATPASGIESLLPPRGTSYKSPALPAHAHQRGCTGPFCKAQPSDTFCHEILSRLLPCIDRAGFKRLELRHPAKFTNIEPHSESVIRRHKMQTSQECSTCRAWH